MRREPSYPRPMAFLLLAWLLILPPTVVHAGLMSNVNQSAAFVRMPARNATTGIDGVYYNPAGLTGLNEGWHFSISNQFLSRDGEVENDYVHLTGAPSSVFSADADAGLFPGVYAVYRINNSAFSLGVNSIRGSGHTDFRRGLPAFEMIVADLVPALHEVYGVTGYTSHMDFEESSNSFGYQIGVSQRISPAVSLFAGGRLTTVKRTYEGGLRDISVNPTAGYDGSYRSAEAFAAASATSFASLGQSYSGAAVNTQTLINAGAGNFTLAQVQTMGYITSAQRAQYESALTALGLTPAQVAAMNMNQVHAEFGTAENYYTTNAALMNGIRWLTADRELEVTQTGSGFAPILGVAFTPGREWTVGLKYEFATKLELKNDTRRDDFGSFPDGAKIRNDLPAQFSLGVSYASGSRVVVSSGLNYYFDRDADYGLVDTMGVAIENSDIIDANYLELAVGAECRMSPKVLLSAGYMYGRSGVSEAYQSLIGFSLDAHTLGFGGEYRVAPNFALNIGFSSIFYRGDTREFHHDQSVPVLLPYGVEREALPPTRVTERFSRSDLILAIGIDYSIRR